MLYDYPSVPHERIHWPAGYTDYKRYKEWLRDEFEFRCVYCLTRERWSHAGAAIFGVDHLLAKSLREELVCEYTNMLYCCNRCNSLKRTDELLDPCREALGAHVRVAGDGELTWRTTGGEAIVRKLDLNDPELKRFRRELIALVAVALKEPDGNTAAAIRGFMGYPLNLPDLSRSHAPKNFKPEGIRKSHFERRKRGELPETY